MTTPLGHLNVHLGQQAADLVDLGGAVAHGTGTGPVDRLLGGLIQRLETDKAPAGALYRFTDRLGIGAVALVRFDKRLDELGSDQSDVMPHRLHRPTPRVGSATGLQADPAGGQIGQHGCQPPRGQLARHTGPALGIDPMHMDRVFPQINAQYDRHRWF